MNIDKQLLLSALNKFFGYSSFRKGQVEIIESILSNRDTLAVLPTGGGKSLCYQLPALLMEGTAIIISPLIALMKDQVDALSKNGIFADFINSALTLPEISERLRKAAAGEYKLLYIAPERLASRQFIDMLSDLRISFLAVDEAHCISEWGHDFRPAYMNIPDAIEGFHKLTVAAFTATATPEVRLDIVKSLKMNSAQVFVKGFDRPNLSYFTENCSDKTPRVAELCSRTKNGSAIVYCGSRKKVDMLTTGLTAAGIENVRYHAGMEDAARKRAQDLFIQGKVKVIVATNAFGMGIDKPDVRFVIHCDFTQTLEAYYQEAGRAGRDGLPSECHLLYQPSDRKLQEFFINTTYPEFTDVASLFKLLLGERTSSGYVALSDAQIANFLGISDYYAKSIIDLMERSGILIRNSAAAESILRFTTSRERIAEYFENTTGDRKKVLEALLRSCGSEAFQKDVELQVGKLLFKFDISEEQFQSSVRALQFAGIVHYKPLSGNGGISVLTDITNPENLPIDFPALDLRRRRAFQKLDQVVRYSETRECKRNFILKYFQEEDVNDNCGRCSSCNFVPKAAPKLVSNSKALLLLVLGAVNELDGRFGKVLIIDYLTGRDNPKIENYGLDSGKLYSMAKKHSPAAVRSELEFAIANGLIAVSPDIYPTVSITRSGLELLSFPNEKVDISNKKPINEDLLRILEGLRSDLAVREGIVPRAVLSDTAIRRITREMPRSVKELSSLTGVSNIFAQKFGKLFLQAINEFIAEEDGVVEGNSGKKTDSSVFRLLINGESIENAAKLTRMTTADAAKIVQENIESGEKLDYALLINDSDYERLKIFVSVNPFVTLREIKAVLNLDISYPELRIALALARQELAKTD